MNANRCPVGIPARYLGAHRSLAARARRRLAAACRRPGAPPGPPQSRRRRLPPPPAACRRPASPEAADDVLRLGIALERLVASRGHIEVVGYLRSALELAPASARPLLADAFVTTSMLTLFLLGQKDAVARGAAKVLADRALEMSEELGDDRVRTRAIALLSGAAHLERDADVARELALEGVEIARRLGDTQLLGELLRCVAIRAPSWDERHRLRLEALACFR
ncbi:MAG: hypothetical protein ABSE47_08545 [Acidimicrobiales bacterium]